MNNISPHPISILAPVAPAWNAMRAWLYRPFQLSTWLGLGFTAWLAQVGEGGFSLDIPLPREERRAHVERLVQLWADHAILISIGLACAVAVALALALLLTWLRCRGAFMFLDNIVHRRSEVIGPWQRAQVAGRSLFLWTLGFAIVSLLSLLPALAPIMALAYSRTHGGGWMTTPVALGLAVPLLLVWFTTVTYINLFLNDFIVPIMSRQTLGARAAWRTFGFIFRQEPVAFIGYGLFRAALNLLLAMVLLMGGCLTCCCLFVILMVPIVWAVILLPVLLFLRLYALEFLRQFGADFDVWKRSEPPRLPPPLPAAKETAAPL